MKDQMKTKKQLIEELEVLRKQAEELLRESEERFSKIFRSSPIAVSIARVSDGKLIEVNDVWCELIGFSKEETVGRNLEELKIIDHEQRTKLRKEILSKGSLRLVDSEITTKSGVKKSVLTSAELITIKGDQFSINLLIDITERKRAEEALRESEERYRSLVENQTELEQRVIERTAQLETSNRELENEVIERRQKEEKIKRQNILLEGINWVVREALTVEIEKELSSQCLAIAEELTESRFGFIYELNEAGTMDNIASTDTGCGVSGMPDTNAPIMQKNIPVHGIYSDTIRKGISVIVNDPALYLDSVAVPEGYPPITIFLGVPLKEGEKVIGLIGLANKESGYDTDDQQSIEMLSVAFVEALNRIRSENIIKTLNKELQQSLDAVSHANKELEAFSYSVSHDLRAPLRAIDGFAEILLREYSPKLDDEGKRICSIIIGNSRKMGQLIDELLALSRLGRAEMHFSPINMKTLVNGVYLELTTPEMQHRINFHLDDLKKAPGDPILIRQVCMNLIANAIKFSSHRERPVISVICREEEDQVVYCVQDNGAGFNMQYAGKLFGVFQRLHSEKEFEGTGVGLAIVQRIVNRHGGKIWAEGEVDKGAAFFFSIPK